MRLVYLAFIFTFSLPLMAYQPSDNRPRLSHEMPEELEGVGITERLGNKVSHHLEFTNDRGEKVTMGDLLSGERPVIFTMVYYNCPSLCNYHLNGLLSVFRNMDGRAGKDFDLVAVSMDHTEGYELAAAKKETYLEALGQPGVEDGWHFLVGSEENVRQIADETGFGFRWNPEIEQYAHAAAAMILTPSGILSRYLYGIEFLPQTMRLSIVEASEGKVGSIIEQIMLFCFQFNPAKNQYTLYAYNLMRAGAAFTVIMLGIFLIPLWIRERNKGTPEGDSRMSA